MNLNIQTSKNYKISVLDKLGYGAGNLGYGLVFQIISVYLVFYATAVLNIPGSLVGLAIGISVVWDSISDPLMGYISDKTHIKNMGRRHFYILTGTIFISLLNFCLWIIKPSSSTNIKFFWILTAILLLKTFMTVFATPYTALGAELSTDYDERTSIQSFKMSLFMLGIALGTSVSMLLFFQPTELYPVGQLNPQAYKNMALWSSLFMLVFGLICFYSTKKYIKILPQKSSDSSRGGIISNLKDALKNMDYRVVVLGYLFTNISSSIIGSIGLHVFTYTFHMDNFKIALVFGFQLLISILSQPFWIWFSKKTDKKPSIILGLLLSILASIYFIMLVLMKNMVIENIFYLFPFALVMGVGSGGLFTIPQSMIADTTDKQELISGERLEGVYYGGMTLGYKLSQSAAIFLLGILLDFVKFNPELPVQTDFTATVLGLVLGIGSIISFTLALLTYSKYSITKEKVLEIQDKIKSHKIKETI